MHSRRFHILMLVVICCIELYIGLYVRDQFIRPFIGDLLIVPLMCFFFSSLWPKRWPLIVPLMWAFALSVEFAQYFDLVPRLGLSHIPMVNILIGRVYDPLDLLAYSLGALLAVGLYVAHMRWVSVRQRALSTLLK
ncbi:hypothetical protein VST7929_01300 [Vibrio stylophorae]|uniref:DUF2809 domain-containing protein n=1 Tax=Vibrio stylophorae TaxID=659351 RepID=A0ABM8ZTE0_9VIBR|nr:DUF2809 domain-containing protein [Vibrio stylophorae]CAH0533432.1 hypothetical protein VST7929_01300 [Vibrio stylophorae]